MRSSVVAKSLLTALLMAPLVVGAAPASDTALPQGVAPDWLDRLNPGIDPETAARIVMFDHPMGSQIRLHEGSLQIPGHPVIDIPETSSSSVKGMDVSGYQGNVGWGKAYGNGARFAYVKATEGTYYTNPYFAQQYDGSYKAGMIRGSYHFARPDTTSGATQADYFVDHGGGWSGDGKTLPGTIDLEWNPYGSSCYGLSHSQMAAWITSFSNEYHKRTTRWPVIYSSASWWSECVGTSGNYSNNSPLWVARYASAPGTLPWPWTYYTIWQYADSGALPGDQDTFNGSYSRLQSLAN